MIRRILVPLDPSAYALSALEYACQLAKAHGARVTGLMVLDTPGISTGPVSPGAMAFAKKAEQRREGEAHEDIQAMLRRFAKKFEEAGVVHREVEVAGDPKEEIIRESRFYDLIVIGLRTFFRFETSTEPDGILKEIVSRVLPPLLAVPDIFKPFHSNLDVLMAYNGGIAAARSVREFAQLAVFSNPNIIILSANQGMEEAKEVLGPAVEYLRVYGYTDVEEAWSPQRILDVVPEKYMDKTDLVVAGVHRKKGIFDFSSGSFTNYLIDHGKVPIFIGQ